MLRAAGLLLPFSPLRYFTKNMSSDLTFYGVWDQDKASFPCAFTAGGDASSSTSRRLTDERSLKRRLARRPMSIWRWTKSRCHLYRNATLSGLVSIRNYHLRSQHRMAWKDLPGDATRDRSGGQPRKLFPARQSRGQGCLRHPCPRRSPWLPREVQ